MDLDRFHFGFWKARCSFMRRAAAVMESKVAKCLSKISKKRKKEKKVSPVLVPGQAGISLCTSRWEVLASHKHTQDQINPKAKKKKRDTRMILLLLSRLLFFFLFLWQSLTIIKKYKRWCCNSRSLFIPAAREYHKTFFKIYEKKKIPRKSREDHRDIVCC